MAAADSGPRTSYVRTSCTGAVGKNSSQEISRANIRYFPIYSNFDWKSSPKPSFFNIICVLLQCTARLFFTYVVANWSHLPLPLGG